MTEECSTPHDQQALKAGAHELQRAAGKVLTHACAAEDPHTLGVALAHIEEALDRLSVGMLQAANAATMGHGDSTDGGHLEPSAEALCFHLRRTADRLREPQLACQSSRFWTRRLVASASSDHEARASGLPESQPHPQPLAELHAVCWPLGSLHGAHTGRDWSRAPMIALPRCHHDATRA
jgi:hypothetical protein